uniref:non-specific serine/threonine protein kinase n=2 Tax=Ascaris TaxID=6251 RepID=A0A0M3IDM1_ASCLU
MSVDYGNSNEGSCERELSDVESLLPDKNCLIRGKNYAFAIGRRIARGRFGAVYEVLRQSDGRRFAAKLEVCDAHFHGLHLDYAVLNQASKANCKHFISLIDRGKIEGHFKFVIMGMLGENLHKLRYMFVECRFSLSTALRVGIQCLAAIEELHSLGFIHRDVKASNFTVNIESSSPLNVYIIDFGLCRAFRNSQNEIKPARDKAQFRGTTRYASITAHNEMEQSPRDDLESWFYMLIEMISSQLPWGDLHRTERDEVKKMKENARTHDGMQQLLKNCPKVEFRRILKYLDGLTYQNQPDYSFLTQLLQLAMKNYGIKADEPYDWQD